MSYSPPFVGTHNPGAVRRDLVGGSPLDRRSGERLSFPHKSLQEFLVAEEIWRRVRDGRMGPGEADPLITDEVATFMAALRGKPELTAVDAAAHPVGLMHSRSVRVFFPIPSAYDSVTDKYRANGNPWHVISWMNEVLSARQKGLPPHWYSAQELNVGSERLLLYLIALAVSPRDESKAISEVVNKLLQPRDIRQVMPRAVESGDLREVGRKHVGMFSRHRMQVGEIIGRGRIVFDERRRHRVLLDTDRLT